jgi:hypothetical protein
LRRLQQERLLLTRLGFPDKAFELDAEISRLRSLVKIQRKKLEAKMLKKSLNALDLIQTEKKRIFEEKLSEEIKLTARAFKREEKELRKDHEKQFLTLLENATRRAVGKVKKCNCAEPYLCCHNKTASYNTVCCHNSYYCYSDNTHITHIPIIKYTLFFLMFSYYTLHIICRESL